MAQITARVSQKLYDAVDAATGKNYKMSEALRIGLRIFLAASPKVREDALADERRRVLGHD